MGASFSTHGARPSHGYEETMPLYAPSARASSLDFADFVAKRPRRPGASMRRSVLRTALSWILSKTLLKIKLIVSTKKQYRV